MTKIYAYLTDQGTAAAETALCDEHMTMKNIVQRLTGASDGISGSSILTDCTGNDELACIECGARGTVAQALSVSELNEMHECIGAAIEIIKRGMGETLPELERARELASIAVTDAEQPDTCIEVEFMGGTDHVTFKDWADLHVQSDTVAMEYADEWLASGDDENLVQLDDGAGGMILCSVTDPESFKEQLEEYRAGE